MTFGIIYKLLLYTNYFYIQLFYTIILYYIQIIYIRIIYKLFPECLGYREFSGLMRCYSEVLWPAESKSVVHFCKPASETPDYPEIILVFSWIFEGFRIRPKKTDFRFGISIEKYTKKRNKDIRFSVRN